MLQHLIISFYNRLSRPNLGRFENMAEDPNAELSRQEYWDERYGKDAEKGEKSYDWLRNFDTIKPFLTKHLPPASEDSSILHMGNGNSVGRSDAHGVFLV